METLTLPEAQASEAPGMGELLLPASLRDFATAFRRRLLDRRFWVVQAMVAAVTVTHALLETVESNVGHEIGAIYFVPATFYFVPVLYASLNFGREGAIPTAIWSALLAVPNIILWHHGSERTGEAFQMGMMICLATVIAGRVDKEIIARRQAENQERARRVSELKYRSLFNSAGEAILLFDSEGRVQEANAAASLLFTRPVAEIRGQTLSSLFGPAGAETIISASAGSSRESTDLAFRKPDGSELWLQPICSRLRGDRGDLMVLALLRDVTERRGFQTYAEEIIRAQEDERQRIARELHDVSLQSIVLLCRRLDAIEETAEKLLPEPVRKATVDARQTAEAIGDELRRFSRDLRPSVLDDLGLVPAIRHLVTELSQRSRIVGRFTVSGTPLRLTSGAELSLFRIAQESLRNVEKHSESTRVTVRLTYQTSAVRLTVTDNGRGFQVPSYTPNLATRGKLGLLGMRERARLAGGVCEVLSWPGKGTRVEVSIPCEPAGEAAAS